MALRIEPVEGIYIEKTFGIDIQEQFRSFIVKSFKVHNDGETTMYLEWPNLSTIKGIVLDGPTVEGAINRTPDINPGGYTTIIVAVKSSYINSLDQFGPGKYEQILKFRAVGYTAPPPPPPPDPQEPKIIHYVISVDPVNSEYYFNDNNEAELNLYQTQFTLQIRMIAVYDDGSRKLTWPDDGFRFDPIDPIRDGPQLRIDSSERVGNIWYVQMENIYEGALDTRWSATCRDLKYLNAAGYPLRETVRFYVNSGQIIGGTGDGPNSPLGPPDNGGTTSPGGGGGDGGATILDEEI